MSLLKYWDGDSWNLVPDGTGLKYWDGNSWEVPNAAYYWNGSAWVLFWNTSDPITLNFYPTFTTNVARNNGVPDYDRINDAANDAKAPLLLGRYAGSEPYHFTSLLRFTGPAIGGTSTLAQYMAARPIVKSASLRLTRMNEAGLSSPVGYIRFGTWAQANAHLLPATLLDGTYHDWSPVTTLSVNGWLRGATKSFSIPTTSVAEMINDARSIMFSEVTSGYMTSGGTTDAYMKIYGLNDDTTPNAYKPMLTVTLDVV